MRQSTEINRAFFFYCIFILGIYIAGGFYGVLWISDEFDWERGLFFAFFCVPLAVAFYSQSFYKPEWFRESPLLFWLTVSILIASFGWGHFLWINAVSDLSKAVVNITLDGATYGFAHQRGGFDWLYRPRW